MWWGHPATGGLGTGTEGGFLRITRVPCACVWSGSRVSNALLCPELRRRLVSVPTLFWRGDHCPAARGSWYTPSWHVPGSPLNLVSILRRCQGSWVCHTRLCPRLFGHRASSPTPPASRAPSLPRRSRRERRALCSCDSPRRWGWDGALGRRVRSRFPGEGPGRCDFLRGVQARAPSPRIRRWGRHRAILAGTCLSCFQRGPGCV